MSIVRVATHAGVSIATVSRVINNSQRVNPRLAELVHRALADLQVNPAKIRRNKGLRRHKPGDVQISTIALVSVGHPYRGWFEVPAIAAVVAEIMRAAEARHIGTLVTELVDSDDLPAPLKSRTVDGALLFLRSGVDSSLPRLLTERIPAVGVMGGPIAPLTFDHVGPDNGAVGSLACDYLLKSGVGAIAFVTCRPEWGLTRLRAQGFAVAAVNAGKQPHIFMEGEIGEFDCIYGRQLSAAADLPSLASRVAAFIRDERRGDASRPVGVFVSRDEELADLYRLLLERGIEPGRDVTLISCDNEKIRLSAIHPRPASIELNPEQVARHAVERLIERIRSPKEPPVRIQVTPTLPSV